MIALVCIDTELRQIRRYIPTVNAGIRGVFCTHGFEIERPQTDDLPRVKGKLPGMERVLHENVPPPGALA